MADPLVESIDPQAASLAPTSDAPLSAEDELAAIEAAISQSDVDVQAPLVDDTEATLPPLGRSFAFDPFARSFIATGGAHGPLETRGLETLKGWVEKALATEQGTSPIYSDEYGLQGVDVVIGSYAASLRPRESRVRDCLTFHPRITDVRDYALVYPDPNDMVVEESFTVIVDDDTPIPISVNSQLRTSDG